MAYNGTGTFVPLSPEYPAVSGAVIYADDWNAIIEDFAAGLTLAMTLDGQSTPSANLPMGNFHFTGLSVGVAPGDSVEYNQVFNSPTFQTPTLVDGRASANPSAIENSTILATTAWTRTLALGPVYSAAIATFMYQNF